MLRVKAPETVLSIIESRFGHLKAQGECVPLPGSLGRILYEDIVSGESIPGFDRSSVDGWAVHASDTFGCSESLPSLFRIAGEVEMGRPARISVAGGECAYVPTGGEAPAGADAVVMVEYSEDYGNGTIGILTPCAPGENIVLKGDDVTIGKRLYNANHRVMAHDIGALSALGETVVRVYKKPSAAIISTGNELIPCSERPGGGQVRDVNSGMLSAAVEAAGGEARFFGISPDDEGALIKLLQEASSCDLIIVSGGSSAGTRDIVVDVVNSLGETFVHGIAMKPGKPTIIGEIEGKPVFGLPGHPVAAYFVFEIFIYPLICSMQGISPRRRALSAELSSAIPSNHGRAEYVPVRLEHTENGLSAIPIRGKSGLITLLAETDGYVEVSRDCEGYQSGASVTVNLYFCAD